MARKKSAKSTDTTASKSDLDDPNVESASSSAFTEPFVLENESAGVTETGEPVSDTPDDPNAEISTTEIVTAPKRAGAGAGVGIMIFAGVVTAALGFLASQLSMSDSLPIFGNSKSLDTVQQSLAEQSAKLDELASRASARDNAIEERALLADLQAVSDGQNALEQSITRASARLEALDARLTDLENRPIPKIGATAEAVDAYKQELANMRTMFQSELARVENAQKAAIEIEQQATGRAENAISRAALAQLKNAVELGEPFQPILDALDDAGVDIPVILSANAETGLPSQFGLVQEFPAAARAALNAAVNAEADAGTTGKLSAFLRTQLGTRSLAPREGSDPDAVLSRAEAALGQGDLAQSIAEIGNLPPAGQNEMSGWLQMADTRLAALNAVAGLATALNE